jgi:hypothetical protein
VEIGSPVCQPITVMDLLSACARYAGPKQTRNAVICICAHIRLCCPRAHGPPPPHTPARLPRTSWQLKRTLPSTPPALLPGRVQRVLMSGIEAIA